MLTGLVSPKTALLTMVEEKLQTDKAIDQSSVLIFLICLHILTNEPNLDFLK